MTPQDATYFSFKDNSNVPAPALNTKLKFKDQSEFLIVKTESIDEDLVDLTERLKQELLHDRAIIFDKFQPFKKNTDKLDILKETKANWKFHDFQNLNKSSIDTIKELFGIEYNERSQLIKQGQQKTTKPLGNPHLSEKKNAANRSRVLSALSDNQTLEVKAIILDLRKNQKLSFGKITEILNEEYHHLCKGKNFYRTSVQRFFKDTIKGISNYRKASVVLDSNLKDIENKFIEIENLERDKNFEKEIVFNIKSSLTAQFRVVIQDAEDDIVFEKDYSKGKITIDIDKHNLLAGFHYLSVFPMKEKFKDEAILAQRIVLRPSFYNRFKDLIKE